MSTILFLIAVFSLLLSIAAVEAYADNWCEKNGYNTEK